MGKIIVTQRNYIIMVDKITYIENFNGNLAMLYAHFSDGSRIHLGDYSPEEADIIEMQLINYLVYGSGNKNGAFYMPPVDYRKIGREWECRSNG